MSLSVEQKHLVQSTFVKVALIADKAAELFYARLFEIDPTTKPLFAKTNMREQGSKLMQMIGAAVSGLDNLAALVPHVEALGKRHVAYGVKKEQYETVGAALIWTLEQGLGADFTPEVKAAWLEVYGILSKTATDAAYKTPMTRDDLLTRATSEKKIELRTYDLIGSNLGAIRLSGVTLVGANLTGANLAYADLSEATLVDTILTGANLSSANLKGANLIGANLVGANLTAAILTKANLSQADLSGVTLTAADLTEANLTESKLLGGLFICANLTGANLSKGNLTGTILTGANLTKANLSEANLRGANLTIANLTEANLEGAKMMGTVGYDAKTQAETQPAH
jgi:uncharacterized protein YjbI with pentapeptide repeats/hemoglobin-like flavoprotein